MARSPSASRSARSSPSTRPSSKPRSSPASSSSGRSISAEMVRCSQRGHNSRRLIVRDITADFIHEIHEIHEKKSKNSPAFPLLSCVSCVSWIIPSEQTDLADLSCRVSIAHRSRRGRLPWWNPSVTDSLARRAMLHAIIMAGGSGTRFWPKSRRDRPKQLLRLAGESTMLQQTVARVEHLVTPDRVVIVTGADQAEATRAQLPGLPVENVIAEPCPRDTAPCVALAAGMVAGKDPDGTMIVMPADHVIEPVEA